VQLAPEDLARREAAVPPGAASGHRTPEWSRANLNG
jgi:hypothetical protein